MEIVSPDPCSSILDHLRSMSPTVIDEHICLHHITLRRRYKSTTSPIIGHGRHSARILKFHFSKKLIASLLGSKMPSKKFVPSKGCVEIVALRSAKQRIRHGRTSRGLYALTIHLKHTHDHQATDGLLRLFSFMCLIPTDISRFVLYSIILPHE